MIVRKIISGAQTGADRGGLDAAIELELPYGGWIPKGRKAEDGRIPDRYEGMSETLSRDYPARTLCNVQRSDGTMIFTSGEIEGGSRLTAEYARGCRRPVIHFDTAREEMSDVAQDAWQWIVRYQIRTLNVAGNRESRSPGIQAWVRDCLILSLI